jgi:hypothetical protein
MAQRRHNHTVQRGYLNFFAVEEKIDCHFVDTGVCNEISTNAAAVRKNFYVTTLPDGSRSTWLEDVMGKLESVVPPILRRIERSWPLPDEDRGPLAEYLGLQAARSVAWDKTYREMTATWIRSKRAKYGYSEAQWASLEEHISSDLHRHEGVVEHKAKMTTLVGSMQWTLLTFDHPHLITSDQPLVAVGGDDDEPLGMIPRGGFTEAVEFLWPMTPRRALVLCWLDKPDEPRPRHGNRRHAAVINARLRAHAQKQWFKRPDSAPPFVDGAVPTLSYELHGSRYSLEAAAGSSRRRRFVELLDEWIESEDYDRVDIPIVRVRDGREQRRVA